MTAMVLGILAGASIRASFAAVLVAAALGALRVRASAARHAAWTAVLVAMLLMPLLPYFVPPIGIPFAAAVSPALRAVAGNTTFSVASQQIQAIARLPRAGLAPSANPILKRSNAEATVGVQNAPYGSTTADRSLQPAVWLIVVLAVYVVVAGTMLIRFLMGWWGAALITRASRPISPQDECLALLRRGDRVQIRESTQVVTPVTVGALAPVILLPTVWREWPDEKVRAVLTHEVAHVHRRDPLVTLAAHLNRCLFWFHPLAWWLERALASTAEQASDEAAIAVMGSGAKYAEILLDMAHTVGQGRGRLSWQGLGMDGSGLLSRRIEAALSEGMAQRTSAARGRVLALSCIAAILLAVACRPSSGSSQTSFTLEERDWTLRTELTEMRSSESRHFQNIDWDADLGPLDSLEATVTKNPDDLAALQQFLVSYWLRYSCKPVAACGNDLVSTKTVDSKLFERRRAHILWLIQHHPDAELADALETRIFPSDLQPFFPGDPVGYAEAKRLWMAQVDGPNVRPIVLGHAADFLEAADRPLAETMLLRAQTLDPNGPWSARLGRHYAITLVGSMGPAGRNGIRMLSVGEPQSAYGQTVRSKLSTSNNDVLLTAAGWFLAMAGGWAPVLDFDSRSVAESCLTRALAINPAAVLAHTAILDMRAQQRWVRGEPLLRTPPAALDRSVAALSESERFHQMPVLARNAYGTLQDISRWDDHNLDQRRALSEQQAKRYAADTLALAPRFRSDPYFGTAVYTANMTLSSLALRDGDKEGATNYLKRAAESPSSEELTYGSDVVFGWRVVRDLVEADERQAVIEFLYKMAHTNIAERVDLLATAAAIGRGEKPRALWTN